MIMPVKIVLWILAVAATATLADWIWYTFGVRHSLTAGVIHGAALLTIVGAALGAASGRPFRGLPIGAAAGIGGALAYYAFIVVIDDRPYGTAIPAAWIVMWLLLAVLEGRWLRAPARRSWAEIAVRGVAAAALSGVTFYLALNTLWGAPPAAGRNYAIQFTAWALAWAPGLMALAAGRTERSAD
ncbi:MAG: hypothetical protein ACREAA_07210 [Candidatus Polarisedimenticolia bacterium]